MRVFVAALLVAAAAQPALADASSADVDREYYDVSAPGGHLGRATWNLSYKYTTRAPREGGCAVDKMTTDLRLKIRMPRWNPQPGANAGQVSHWHTYVAALEVHEQGHLQNGRAFESAFLSASRGMRAAHCAALSAMLRERFDALLQQTRQRDIDYDAQTRHGATQGAIF